MPAPRPKDHAFFTDYWRTGRPRWRVYRYQWFLRPCREFIFEALTQAPPGTVLEIGRGGGSVGPGERQRPDVVLDIVHPSPLGIPGITADAHYLPFLDGSLSGLWEQTMLMHVNPTLVAAEASRVLRQGGVFAVVEPLDGHPVVAAARRVLPGRQSDARFLGLDEVHALGSGFTRGEVRPFFLLSPFLLPVGRMARPVRLIQNLDARILARLPTLHRRAWYAAAWFQK